MSDTGPCFLHGEPYPCCVCKEYFMQLGSNTSEASYTTGMGTDAPKAPSPAGTWVPDSDLRAMQACYAQARAVVRAFKRASEYPTNMDTKLVFARAMSALSEACGMGPLKGG
jgi:hypothetical protein